MTPRKNGVLEKPSCSKSACKQKNTFIYALIIKQSGFFLSKPYLSAQFSQDLSLFHIQPVPAKYEVDVNVHYLSYVYLICSNGLDYSGVMSLQT